MLEEKWKHLLVIIAFGLFALAMVLINTIYSRGIGAAVCILAAAFFAFRSRF